MSKSSSGKNPQSITPKSCDKSEKQGSTPVPKCENTEKIVLQRKKRSIAAAPSRQNAGPDGSSQNDFY